MARYGTIEANEVTTDDLHAGKINNVPAGDIQISRIGPTPPEVWERFDGQVWIDTTEE